MALSALALTLFSCQSEEAPIEEVVVEKPKNVCALYSNVWCEAKIISDENGEIKVKYYDGVEASLTPDEIKYPLEKEKIKAGDRVMAVWQKGSFYDGEVTEVKDDGAMVKWDDGSSPSLVAYGKIVKGSKKKFNQLYSAATGRVSCLENNGSYTEVKILSEKDGIAHIIQTDNSEKDVPTSTLIVPITDMTKVNVNDKVYAIWASSVFYPGEVSAKEANGILVRWKDGSKPSFVETGKFFKKAW